MSSIHRARMLGTQKHRETVDKERLEQFYRGKIGVKEGLGLEPDKIEALRKQAHSLFEAGKIERSVDVFHGVFALANPRPEDLLILAKAYNELERHEEAWFYEAQAYAVLDEMEYQLWLMEQGDVQ